MFVAEFNTLSNARVQHDSFLRMTRLLHACDMTHSYA